MLTNMYNIIRNMYNIKRITANRFTKKKKKNVDVNLFFKKRKKWSFKNT